MIFLRHIRLRSITASQSFGADIPMESGLNIIQADNTSGKSTCVQSIIYGLGLERALGSRLEVPLPYAMRERIERIREGEYENVLQSYVMLELENASGERLTVRRDITGGTDRKLVQCWQSGISEVDSGNPKQQDFFLHDGGSASREDGFHFYLANFIGWDLPTVTQFDGGECPLYLETLFPMFFVEQKRGWATIQGPLPTFFGIQDLPRRVMEFLLDLDAGRVRRERAELRRVLGMVEAKYKAQRAEIVDRVGSLLRVEGVPQAPTVEFAQGSPVHLAIYNDGEWRSVDEISRDVSARIEAFDDAGLEAVEEAEEQLRASLKEAEDQFDESTAELSVVRQDYRIALSERDALDKRVEALNVDLHRNQDALKLQTLGSKIGSAGTSHVCPTCHQDVSQELLPDTGAKTMGLEENITFIKSQLNLYQAMLGSSERAIEILRVRYRALDDQLGETRARLRSLRNDLVRPSSSPARSELEEIVRLQSRLEQWSSLQEKIDGALDGLRSVAKEWGGISERLKALGIGRLSAHDREKVSFLQWEMQGLLEKFGFRSFRPSEITLSDDNFRPQVLQEDEGEIIQRDIGFEASASDGIRLKWAYYLSLLELSKKHHTHHLGLVVFDEPGQQQMKEVDLSAFLEWAAQNVSRQRQVIVTTSQVRERVRSAVSRGEAKLHEYEGFILRPLGS